MTITHKKVTAVSNNTHYDVGSLAWNDDHTMLVAANSIVGNNTGSTASALELTVPQVWTMLGAYPPAYFNTSSLSLVQKTMASPPTVGAATGTSGIASGRFFCAGSESFNLDSYAHNEGYWFTPIKGAIDTSTPIGYNLNYKNVTTDNGPTYGANNFGAIFCVSCTQFEIVFQANSTPYLMKIDGEYVSTSVTTTGGSAADVFFKYTFASYGTHRVEFFGFDVGFRGVVVDATGTVFRDYPRGPRVIIMGDSFVGYDKIADNIAQAFTDATGWEDVWSSGVGGTGYLATNGGTRPTFRDRVVHDVINYSPDIVIILGIVNDIFSTPSLVIAEANTLYAQLRAALPNAKIYAAPNGSSGPNAYASEVWAILDGLSSACTANNITWINLLSLPLPTTTPATGKLNSGNNAGTAGATGISLWGSASTIGVPKSNCTIEIGTGATRERVYVTSFSQTGTGTGPHGPGEPLYNVKFDGTLQHTHAALEDWKIVGNGLWTGHGNAGATTGFGNCDVLVSADGLHPSAEGRKSIGRALAVAVMSDISN